MAVQMSPAMYSQIVDECDEIARDFALVEDTYSHE